MTDLVLPALRSSDPAADTLPIAATPAPAAVTWQVATRTNLREVEDLLDSLEAQRRLPTLSGVHNTAYCGAYHGWGFHEDGCVSGVRAALALGCAW